jgi:hypothetical protein
MMDYVQKGRIVLVHDLPDVFFFFRLAPLSHTQGLCLGSIREILFDKIISGPDNTVTSDR